jgi:hypothetical protein
MRFTLLYPTREGLFRLYIRYIIIIPCTSIRNGMFRTKNTTGVVWQCGSACARLVSLGVVSSHECRQHAT